MKIHDVMTAEPRVVRPDDTLVGAAGLMREMDVGAVPVCDGSKLTGMLTDRDIAIRAVADGRDPKDTRVREAMSGGIVYVREDDEAETAARLMEQHQIRRLPVIDREKRLVGMVSLGDLAVRTSPDLSGEALKDVSQPSQPAPAPR